LKTPLNLSEHRKAIDALDEQIVRLLNERTKHVLEIGHLKRKNGEEIYGAVLSGEHVFFVLEAGKPPRLDGHARYVHLWLKRDGDFKMARILSIDHGPATSTVATPAFPVSSAVLDRYVGTFTSQKFGELFVVREGDHLALDVGGKHRPVYPSDVTTFTMRDRDVSFQFVLSNGTPEKIIVREHGELVDEALPVARK